MYHVNVTGMMNDRCVLRFFRADRGRRSHVLASDASRGQKRGRMKPDWGHCHQLPRIVRDTVTALGGTLRDTVTALGWALSPPQLPASSTSTSSSQAWLPGVFWVRVSVSKLTTSSRT